MGYSGGVRQKLVRLHNGTAGFRINPEPAEGASEVDYWGELEQATFCVSPAGHGWGIRMYEVMAKGCIPVIIQVSALYLIVLGCKDDEQVSKTIM